MTLSPVFVVVTRPTGQETTITRQLQTLGDHIRVIHCPLIAVKALPPNILDGSERSDKPSKQKQTPKIKHYDGIIFISSNAVHYGLAWVKQHGLILPQTRLGAIGSKTAETLKKAGQHVTWQPAQCFTSEAFLALPSLRQIQGKSLLIVRGQGGRETLRETLMQRRARVDYLEVYQRQCPPKTIFSLLEKQHLAGQLDVMLLTSNESLHNLLTLMGNAVSDNSWIFSIPLISGSSRMTDSAKNAGFNSPIITANNPSDQAMLQAFIQWQPEFKHDR